MSNCSQTRKSICCQTQLVDRIYFNNGDLLADNSTAITVDLDPGSPADPQQNVMSGVVAFDWLGGIPDGDEATVIVYNTNITSSSIIVTTPVDNTAALNASILDMGDGYAEFRLRNVGGTASSDTPGLFYHIVAQRNSEGSLFP